MTKDKRKQREMLKCCDQIGAEDGMDPRDFFRPPRISRKEDHRTERLCHQVAEVLHLVLASALQSVLADEIYECLLVERVAPAPNASRLRVTLRWQGESTALVVEEVERGLALASGRLRCEVAAAITRRKAPLLVFEILPPTLWGADEGGTHE